MAFRPITIHSKLLRSTFTQKHLPAFPTYIMLDNKSHPFYYRVKARYLAHPRDTLWVQTRSSAVLGKSVLRHRCRRRLNEALKEALKEAGFDWHGRPFKNMDGGDGRGMGLIGTLQVVGTKDLLEADWGSIKQEASNVVNIMKASCKKIRVSQEERVSNLKTYDIAAHRLLTKR